MTHLVKAVRLLLVSQLGGAQAAAPADALDRYLARQHDASAAEPLRLWGNLVRSPSILSAGARNAYRDRE